MFIYKRHVCLYIKDMYVYIWKTCMFIYERHVCLYIKDMYVYISKTCMFISYSMHFVVKTPSG